MEEIANGEFVVEVELSGATDQAVTFDIALGGGTALKDTDYENPTSLTGRIEVGSTTTTITIPISPDTLNEGNETFNLTLSNLSGAVFEPRGTTLVQEIIIVDNEMPTLLFKGEPFSIAENGTEIEVTVALTGPTSSNVTFAYEIVDGTAIVGTDYTLPSNLTGMIQTGSTEDSITIAIMDDSANDGNKSFIVRLKTLSGAVFASGDTLDATITIEDDEDPVLSFKTTEFTPSEEITGGKFEVVVEIPDARDENVTFDIAVGGGSCD